MTDNMKIWNAVSKTDPAHTKQVNQRGGFTSINAQSQIMEATRQFGPIGIGWGYTTGDPIFHDTLMFVPVTLWHGDRANVFGPILGCEEWKDSKGRVDSDVGKKATTDAITKLLSQLGFNADVFLGLWDDNKYVAERKRETANDRAEPAAPATKITDSQVTLLIDHLEAKGIPARELIGVANDKLGTNIDKITDLPASAFDNALSWVKSYRKAA